MSSLKPKPTGGWTLCEGVEFIRKHQGTAFGLFYNLSLGGSVLNRCRSEKDLDIFCTPACWRDEKDTATIENAVAFLAWLRVAFPNERVETSQEWNGSMVKYACTLPDGRWLDWFVVIGWP